MNSDTKSLLYNNLGSKAIDGAVDKDGNSHLVGLMNELLKNNEEETVTGIPSLTRSISWSVNWSIVSVVLMNCRFDTYFSLVTELILLYHSYDFGSIEPIFPDIRRQGIYFEF